MKIIKIIEDISERIEMNSKDKNYLGKVSDDLAIDVFELIQSFVDRDEYITEQFTSSINEQRHFNKHCLGTNKKNKKVSHRSAVYYDFNNQQDYSTYENKINAKCKHPDICIYSLLNTQEVLKAIRKLFGGNYTIEFHENCGFDSRGPIIVCLNSFASDVTTNYTSGNTINFCILNTQRNTMSMFAIDANYLETKLNNVIQKYNKNKQIRFAWNH